MEGLKALEQLSSAMLEEEKYMRYGVEPPEVENLRHQNKIKNRL